MCIYIYIDPYYFQVCKGGQILRLVMAQVRYACDALCQGLLLEMTEVGSARYSEGHLYDRSLCPEIQLKMSNG